MSKATIVIPEATQQEKLVLIQLYLSEGQYFSIAERKGITSDHFAISQHKELFMTLRQIYGVYDILSMQVILDYYSNNTDKATQIQNVLRQLQEKVINRQVSESMFEKYLDNLISNTFRRKLFDFAETYIKQDLILKRLEAKPDELLDSAIKHLLSISKNISTDACSISDLALPLIDTLQERFKNSNKKYFFTTGIAKLDDLTEGFNSSELNIVAARPSQGKTALMIQMAYHLHTLYKTPIGIVSYEQTAQDLMIRYACHASNCSFSELTRDKKICYEQLISKIDNIYPADSKLYFIPSAESAKLLMLALHRAVEKYDLRIVMIDYLQLMNYDNRYAAESRSNELAKITRELKKFAINYKVCVILLSQLNRNIDNREGDQAKPRLSDLRDSGAIEQDADKVLFIHRPDALKTTHSQNDNATLILAKNRNGAVGEVKCVFNRRLMRFQNFLT